MVKFYTGQVTGELLEKAEQFRESGLLNQSELIQVALVLQGIQALGGDIIAAVATLGNYDIPDAEGGGEAEAEKVDSTLEGDPGDESPVRPPVSEATS